MARLPVSGFSERAWLRRGRGVPLPPCSVLPPLNDPMKGQHPRRPDRSGRPAGRGASMLASKARSRGRGKKGLKSRLKAKEFMEEYPLLGSSPFRNQEGGGEQVLKSSGQEETLRVNRVN
ncbi:hypothetical protein NDU88_007701 [Pleurodeles waltl]|uniref:Uncharacterized protein n=1 Tax=Pleurodeles waltl TaxID=8319 RepID=A0AAV7NVP2_PLEWA|nr:hypothetical protein NDU88_007701 [Pleurodeles waltl]